MTETFITFGVQYKQNPTHPSEEHPMGMHGDGYAVIAGVDRDRGRAIAHGLFDGKYAFDYAAAPKPHYAPAGEILRVVVLGERTLKNAREVIQETLDMAEGDSNDEEIQSLQQARDLLATIIGWKEEA